MKPNSFFAHYRNVWRGMCQEQDRVQIEESQMQK